MSGEVFSLSEMTKPNFTGTWKFNPAASVLQIQAPDATIIVIEHREPKLRLSRTHVSGEKQDTFSLVLRTDGKEIAAAAGGRQLRCRAHWEGESLVFESILGKSPEEATNVVRYTLSGDGKSLRAEEHFRSESLNYDNVWLLDRTQSGN